MLLENLAVGSTFAVPALGVEEATLLDLCSGYGKVKVLRGRFSEAGPQTWAPGTEVKLLPVARPSEPKPATASVRESITVAPTKEILMATTTKTAAPKTKAPKAAGKAETNGHAKKDGLRKPQVRILAYLAKCKAPVARKQIAEKAPADLAFCTEYLGSDDEAKRAHNDTKPGGFPCLITLKAVKAKASQEENGGTEYEITATGRQLLEKALKA